MVIEGSSTFLFKTYTKTNITTNFSAIFKDKINFSAIFKNKINFNAIFKSKITLSAIFSFFKNKIKISHPRCKF